MGAIIVNEKARGFVISVVEILESVVCICELMGL